MNLNEFYDLLYDDAVRKIGADNCETDPWLNSDADERRGITLLIRPEDRIRTKIENFLCKIREIEPEQYFYPESDIHITVLSIISCYCGFSLSQIDMEDYIEPIRESICGFPPFEIEFNGLTASPSCLMIRGFPKNNSLMQIRNNLRKNFRNSTLEHSIDKRYAIQTAHATVVRFRKPLRDKDSLLKAIEKYRNYSFGTFTVNAFELVFNDWYNRQAHRQNLFHFDLK